MQKTNIANMPENLKTLQNISNHDKVYTKTIKIRARRSELYQRSSKTYLKMQNPENVVRIYSFISTKMPCPKHISRQIAGNGVSGPI